MSSQTVTGDIFVADADGWRSQNIDRPPEHLVRELVQNALDEDGVTQLDITVTYHGPRKGTTVAVKDNAPGGVRDMRLLFTIWMSDKEDSPTKRGRMGRGLKELVSVADMTVIRSCSQDALLFKRHKGGRWVRKTAPKLGRPDAGTEVTAFVRGWGEKASKGIVAFLKRVRAPGTVTMHVNHIDASKPCQACLGIEATTYYCGACQGSGKLTVGGNVAPFTAPETYRICLETVVYEVADGERKARERWLHTRVECFAPPPGEKAQVYEMGIPVEECDGPVSIDVGQRVILRERRDTLTESYRRTLLAEVLSARISQLTDTQLTDNAALIAASRTSSLSNEAKRRIANVWTGGLPFATSPQAYQNATAHHINAISLRALPESVRDIVKEVGTSVQTVLDARRGEFCPEISPLSDVQQRLVTFWEWIARGIGRPCRVSLRAGTPASADFNREDRVLSLYVEAVGKRFIADPASAKALSLLGHELSHWAPKENEHGSEFHADCDDVGGLMAAFLLGAAEQARLLVRP